MGVPHYHLRCAMSQKFPTVRKSTTGHYQSTGEGVTVAMPGVVSQFGSGHCIREPSTNTPHNLTSASREPWVHPHISDSQMPQRRPRSTGCGGACHFCLRQEHKALIRSVSALPGVQKNLACNQRVI